MEVGLSAHRADLTVAEETGQGDLPERLRDGPGVVVWLPEEPDPAAVAGAEDAAGHLDVAEVLARLVQAALQVLVRRFGVADPFDPRQNIFGGVQYLRLLLDMFGGDVSLTLAAYNAGENAVTRFGGIPPFKVTRAYVKKILGLLGGSVSSVRVSRAST